jgi:hypothetical protein
MNLGAVTAHWYRYAMMLLGSGHRYGCAIGLAMNLNAITAQRYRCTTAAWVRKTIGMASQLMDYELIVL